MMISEYKKVLLAKAAYIQDRIDMEAAVLYLLPSAHQVVSFYVEKTDTEAFAVRIDDTAIIGFSGTEGWLDIWHDLQFIPSAYENLQGEKIGHVHFGFKKILRQIKGPVNEALKTLFPNGGIHTIIIVGHSLGGAIAIGCADLITVDYKKLEITTYGCPNGWSRAAKRRYMKKYKIRNYINWFDFVPLSLIFFTVRPGNSIYLCGFPGHRLNNYINWIKRKDGVNEL